MSDTESIERALIHPGESADPVFPAVAAESVAPPRKNLVGIRLMPDIEDNLVFRGIVNLMKPDNEFHGPETGTEVPGIDGAAFYHIASDLGTELFEFRNVKFLYVFRRIYILKHFLSKLSLGENLEPKVSQVTNIFLNCRVFSLRKRIEWGRQDGK